MRLAAALDERGAIPIHVRWVLASYVPRLEARSAEIAREQEFVADRAAAAMTNGRTAADTLVAIEIGDKLVRHTYWPRVFQKVEQHREPPLPFAEMAAAVDNLADDGARAELLASLLQDETECHDTHPSLRDRLQALDELPRVPEAGGRKAGEAYVGPVLREIARRLDEEWQACHRTRWQQRHAELEAAQLRLADLEAQSAKTADAAFERAGLLERLGREDDALAAYRAAVELDHAHGPAVLAAGRMLLGIGEDAGAAMVERAMQLDHNLVPEACALLAGYYRDQGRPAEAQRYRTRATRHATRSAIEAEERSAAGPLDRFAPHGLAGRELAALTAALGREAEIDGALLARKHFRHSAGSMLVLGLITGRVDSNDLASRIHGAGLLPSDTQVVVLNRDQRPLQCALEAVHGSRVYGRGASAIVPASS
jgi:tetratricopeptide (TPR) repeat protein